MDRIDKPIEGQQLTAWAVSAGGTHVRMEFVGTDATPYQIVLPFDAVSSLLMRLPRIVRTALNTRSADGSLHFAQGLGSGHIEQAAADDGLRLATTDGFEVAFALHGNGSGALGAALLAAPDMQTSRRLN
jgi:hypothetical protein